jgi:hypothetical protein
MGVWEVKDFMVAHTGDMGMILGPCIGYMIQCYKIRQEKNAQGFSPLVCLVLLVANILRVFWW